MKYITKYSSQEVYFSDVSEDLVAKPNVTWAVDTDTVHYLSDSELIYYGRIPNSVVVTNWEDVTPSQIRFYCKNILYMDATTLPVSLYEGDKLIVLYPSRIPTVNIYKDNGFGDSIPFYDNIFGCNGEPIVSINNCDFKVYGEIITVKGDYNIIVQNG